MSTREVDDLVKALGADSGISRSEVSRICADLDEEVAAFRDRPLSDSAFPYVFLYTTYCKPRCAAWPAPSWSKPTTNGKCPTAAACPKAS